MHDSDRQCSVCKLRKSESVSTMRRGITNASRKIDSRLRSQLPESTRPATLGLPPEPSCTRKTRDARDLGREKSRLGNFLNGRTHGVAAGTRKSRTAQNCRGEEKLPHLAPKCVSAVTSGGLRAPREGSFEVSAFRQTASNRCSSRKHLVGKSLCPTRRHWNMIWS